ncbi:MAG TPA: hypothetical protein ENK66_00030 [Arcobacter sp.]|jgi:tetratricopeptide (TPR) repeat protein|nr:hypothetical protein [Arcobacter sp.]
MKYIVIFVLLITSLCFAGEDKKYQLQKTTYDTVIKAQQFLDKNQSKKAEKTLLSLASSKKLSKKLDKAYIEFYLGYYYTLQNNDNLAIKHFQNAVKNDVLPPRQITSAYINLTQLSLSNQAYANALRYVNKLIQTAKPIKPEYYTLKANILFSQKKYAKTIEVIKKAEKVANKKKIKWMKIEFYCYYLQKKYQDAIRVNKELIQREPYNKEYWIQLASLYAIDKHYDYSLSALDISRIANFKMNKNEWMRLIDLLRYEGLPFKAANIMSEKINDKTLKMDEKDLNMVGDLYYESKEFDKAILFYQKAAKIHANKKIFFKIAKIEINRHSYKEAINYTKKALNGSEEQIGEKELLLGRAYYAIHMNKLAKRAFQSASMYKKTKKRALQWLKYIKNEGV